MSLPIASTTRKRNFLAVCRIKTRLHTCMLQDQFNNLAILYMKKDVMINNIENIIDVLVFTSKNK